MLWLSGMRTGNHIADAANALNGERAITTGGTLDVYAFRFMAQYSNAEGAIDPHIKQKILAQRVKWDQYVLQAGYQFNEKTLLSVNYSKHSDLTPNVDVTSDKSRQWTLGVYHDISEHLKLIAEYNDVEQEDHRITDRNIISLGARVHF